MTTPTFKQFLMTEAKKDSGDKKEDNLFNPQRFVPKVEEVLDLLIKKSAMEGEMANQLVILEMLSIVKEVLVDRLKPYKDPSYKERKGEDEQIETLQNVKQEIEDVLRLHFSDPKFKPAINSFINLIATPILKEVQRVGMGKAAGTFDEDRFDHKAKDEFGHLMRYVVNSVIIPDAEDAEVAGRVLSTWSADARKRERKEKKLTKNQRLNVIRRAAEKMQDVEKDVE